MYFICSRTRSSFYVRWIIAFRFQHIFFLYKKKHMYRFLLNGPKNWLFSGVLLYNFYFPVCVEFYEFFSLLMCFRSWLLFSIDCVGPNSDRYLFFYFYFFYSFTFALVLNRSNLHLIFSLSNGLRSSRKINEIYNLDRDKYKK